MILMIDVIAIGELLVDMIADVPGKPLEEQTTFKRFAGGAPANFAVGVRMLGVPSAMISKVGNDFFGRFLIETLKKKQVDISQIKITNDYKTALAFVGLDESKSPTFSFSAPAWKHPCPLAISLTRFLVLNQEQISLSPFSALIVIVQRTRPY